MKRRSCGAAAIVLAMLQVSCSRARTFGDDDPYARCSDLGDLALVAASQADAQRQMVARVVALGGDTLLFGVRGRSGRLAATPEEIVQRRKGLLAEGDARAGPPVTAAPTEHEPEPEPEVVAIAGAADGPPRAGRAVIEPIPDSTGELWYYGAALRCDLR